MQLAMDSLRADLELADRWSWRPEPPVDLPITALHGASDEIPAEVMERWSELPPGDFTRRELPGGHFFLHEAESELLAVLSGTLAR